MATSPGVAGASGDPPLLEAKVVFTVDLHPSRTLAIQDAIRDELNAKLMRCAAAPAAPRSAGLQTELGVAADAQRPFSSFDDELGGVMLAYWRERMAARTVRRRCVAQGAQGGRHGARQLTRPALLCCRATCWTLLPT